MKKNKKVLIIVLALLLLTIFIAVYVSLNHKDKNNITDAKETKAVTEINTTISESENKEKVTLKATIEPDPEHEIESGHKITPIEMSSESIEILGNDLQKAQDMITEIVISYYYDSVEKVKIQSVKQSEKNADEIILSFKAVREVDRYFDLIYNTETKQLRYILW